MNRKLLLLLALLLFSYGLSSCSSDDNSPSEGEQTETPELFTKRYNPDQSFYSKILGQEIKYSVLLPQEYLSESTGKYGVVFLTSCRKVSTLIFATAMTESSTIWICSLMNSYP